MKDWQRSPEPPSMMGPSSSQSHRDTVSSPLSLSASPAMVNAVSIAPSVTTVEGTDVRSPTTTRPRTKVHISLAEMARRMIMQKLHLYDTFGNTPFPIVRPILEQCPAKKLWALEEESPHLQQHTDYIWKRHCIKDFKDINQAFHAGTLPESESWRSMYEAKQSAQQEALDAAAARVKEKYASIHADKVASRIRVVSGAIPARGRMALRGRSMGPVGNLTTGQKLLRDARKQGNARMQLTQGLFKPTPIRANGVARPIVASTPSSPSVVKKPRTDGQNEGRSICASQEASLSRDATTRSYALPASHSPSTRPSTIFLTTKRRIVSGNPEKSRF